MTSNDELVKKYKRSIAHRSDGTKKSYLALLGKFTRFCDELEISLIDVSRSDISDYLSRGKGRNGNGYKNKTQKLYKTVLTSFYEFMIEEGFTDHTPSKKLTVGGEGIEPKTLMLDDDFQLMIDQCDSLREKALLHTFYYTGVRGVELRNLRIDYIDFKRNKITVTVSKTKKGLRKIPMNPDLKPILRTYLEERKNYQIKGKPLPHDFLFVTTRGSMFSSRTLANNINNIQKKLGTKFTGHDFRVSFITRLYRATKNIVMCQRYAGHSEIATTRRYIVDDTQEDDIIMENLNF